MPIDEQQKNTLVINLSNVIRQSGMKVDVQRISMAFRALVDELEPGEPIELEGMFQHLSTDLGIPEKEALELCVVISARSDVLRVQFVLPIKGQQLTPDAIEHIVAQHTKRTAPQAARKPDEKAAPEPKKAAAGWQPDKRPKRAPMPQRKKLLIALAATVFAGVSFNSWYIGTLEDPIAPVAVPPGGLPCVAIVTNGGGTAICTITEAVYKAGPAETLKAKGMLTKQALRGNNVKELWVRVQETRRIMMVF